ncbi:Hypothetical predicted protein, partial [Paramuricea clavata]
QFTLFLYYKLQLRDRLDEANKSVRVFKPWVATQNWVASTPSKGRELTLLISFKGIANVVVKSKQLREKPGKRLTIKTKSLETVINTCAKLRITCCNQTVLRKMDILGENHDELLKTAKQNLEDTFQEENGSSVHPGYTIPFDNVDVRIERRQMTKTSQNMDCHWVNHLYVENRISGSHLPTHCNKSIDSLENIDLLVSAEDEKKQRFDFAILVSRFLVEYFEHFEFLKQVCVLHIQHRYSKEMAKKSVKAPLGIIFKNENTNEEMIEILKQLQSYLPKQSIRNETKFDPQLFAGDQLTVERAINVIQSVMNGYTPEDRLEGIIMQLGDWHAGLKILSMIYERFYSVKNVKWIDAHRYIWNRGVNNHGMLGKNIPLDLEVEHSNHYLKQAVKNLGPNVNPASISRICKSEKCTRTIINTLQESVKKGFKSGKHTNKNDDEDLKTIVDKLVEHHAFVKQNARTYHSFNNIDRNPLLGLDISMVYKWINEHKENIKKNTKAR